MVDRVMLLSALSEAGTLRLSEAISMATGTCAIPIIVSMILNRQITSRTRMITSGRHFDAEGKLILF
ncbi:hypothetical protein [Pararhizobium sp. DWP3-4]|uniref:hypothetical protein n=1 Tax=Pararhizobium sp. DWP3-4 TaxID=2804565 RepID=UPI003CE9F5FE